MTQDELINFANKLSQENLTMFKELDTDKKKEIIDLFQELQTVPETKSETENGAFNTWKNSQKIDPSQKAIVDQETKNKIYNAGNKHFGRNN